MSHRKHTYPAPVIEHAQSGEPHEFVMNGDRAWLTVGDYSLFITKDTNYEGLRVEAYRHGNESELPVDALYGAETSGPIPPPRLNHK